MVDHAQDRLNRRTIAAIATPPGRGGIGVIRVSGPRAQEIGLRLSGRSWLTPRYCHFATFRDTLGDPLDEGLIAYFSAPHSYTGEDVVECHGHGGPAVLHGVLEAIFQLGAAPAEPGEFTHRAFLNDRLDLSQAEAVAALIEADTRAGARAALRSLEGEFGRQVDQLVEEITNLRVFVEGALDFPDEDVDFLEEAGIVRRINDLRTRVIELHRRATCGVRLGQGYKVVIVGRPNAGKSTLLNHLSGRESAIVTERAGTTRDVLREAVEVAGYPVELIDTAGLRETNDSIEIEGVRRTRDQVVNADLILYLVDSSVGWEHEDAAEWQVLPEDRLLRVWTKTDLNVGGQAIPPDEPSVSIHDVKGLEPLIQALSGFLDPGAPTSPLGARQRHVELLHCVGEELDQAAKTLSEFGSGDLIAQDLLRAQEALGEITGRIHSDEFLGRIFATFCIGK